MYLYLEQPPQGNYKINVLNGTHIYETNVLLFLFYEIDILIGCVASRMRLFWSRSGRAVALQDHAAAGGRLDRDDSPSDGHRPGAGAGSAGGRRTLALFAPPKSGRSAQTHANTRSART